MNRYDFAFDIISPFSPPQTRHDPPKHIYERENRENGFSTVDSMLIRRNCVSQTPLPPQKCEICEWMKGKAAEITWRHTFLRFSRSTENVRVRCYFLLSNRKYRGEKNRENLKADYASALSFIFLFFSHSIGFLHTLSISLFLTPSIVCQTVFLFCFFLRRSVSSLILDYVHFLRFIYWPHFTQREFCVSTMTMPIYRWQCKCRRSTHTHTHKHKKLAVIDFLYFFFSNSFVFYVRCSFILLFPLEEQD